MAVYRFVFNKCLGTLGLGLILICELVGAQDLQPALQGLDEIPVISEDQLLSFGQPYTNTNVSDTGAILYSRRLLGLYVDGDEKSGIAAIYDGQQHYAPWSPL